MGRLRFIAPGREQLMTEFSPQGYMAGLEGIPWVTHCSVQENELHVERQTHESGMFYMPWHVPGRAEMMLSTTTLMEREEPYHLPLELARGTLNRLRGQMSNWQHVGLNLTKELEEQVHEATYLMAQAATQQHRAEYVTTVAEKANQMGLAAIEELGRLYAEQAIKLRLQSGPLNTLLGGRLEDVPQGKAAQKYLSTFNAVVIPFLWRDIEHSEGDLVWDKYDALIEWAKQNNLKICGGPLVQLDIRSLPEWSYIWEEEWDDLQGYILNHVANVVNRYRGKVHLWNIAGRVNVEPVIQIAEEQMLRLVVDAAEVVRNTDSRIPMVVSFDQPWSEHMGHKDRDLPPLHFADTLARAEIGIAGFGLELNWGYWPHGSPERDCIEVSRLIDRWTSLGHPLMVSITAPSNFSADPKARDTAKPITDKLGDYPSPSSQTQIIEQIVSVLLAKSSVQALFWNQWSDTDPHDFPHSGLIDVAGRLKPSLRILSDLRRRLQG
jgi:Glycosyl hydrolase family 10